jgi:hypothetical protein
MAQAKIEAGSCGLRGEVLSPMALVGNLYPVPVGPYGKLPYIYLVYLAAGMLWFFFSARNPKPLMAES